MAPRRILKKLAEAKTGKRAKKSARKATKAQVAKIREDIDTTGALIEQLFEIRELLGDTPELSALITSEAVILRELITALLTARGIVITPVITVSDADIVDVTRDLAPTGQTAG